MAAEIEKTKTNALASVVPDYLKDVHGHEGLEKADKTDLILPRLSVCQDLSPQRKESKPNHIPGLKEGQIFNTVTEQILGDKVDIQIVAYSKSRIYFKPLEQGGGIQCQSQNGINGGKLSPTCDICPNSQFNESAKEGESKAPKCNLFMNFVVITPHDSNMAIVSCKSAELKSGRALVTRMQMFNKPSYVQIYEARVVTIPGPKGDFYGRNFTFKRWATEAEAKNGQLQYEALKGKVIAADPDEEVFDEEEDTKKTPF